MGNSPKRQRSISKTSYLTAPNEVLHRVDINASPVLPRPSIRAIQRSAATDDTVKQWLNDIVQLPQYHTNFKMNGYLALHLLREISDVQHLIDIDIVEEEHQNRILTEIKKLVIPEYLSDDEEKKDEYMQTTPSGNGFYPTAAVAVDVGTDGLGM